MQADESAVILQYGVCAAQGLQQVIPCLGLVFIGHTSMLQLRNTALGFDHSRARYDFQHSRYGIGSKYYVGGVSELPEAG